MPDDASNHGRAVKPTGSGDPEVSVVIPVYRNAGTLVELLDQLDAALGSESREYVFVVDGSPDESLAILRDETQRRPQLVVVELAQNYGQHAALCAGFEVARGQVACILDADLQQRPAELPAFLEQWRAGHDFVSGRRRTREDPLLRKLGSAVLNRVIRQMIRVPLSDWGCPVAAVDRSILDRIPLQGEQRRFLKPLVAKLARRVIELDVVGQERVAGPSAYSLLTLIGVSLDAGVSFSNRPFQRLAGLGFVLSFGSTLVGVGYLGMRLFGTVADSPPVIALVTIGLLLGIQFLILGALGEFTHRIYRMVQGQPLFRIFATHAGGQVRPFAGAGAGAVAAATESSNGVSASADVPGATSAGDD